MRDLSFDVSLKPHAVVVSVTGELDLYTAAELRPELLAAADQTDPDLPLELNLSGLALIDSSGLALLITTQRRANAQGSHVVLKQVPELLSRMLAFTGLTEMFPATNAPDQSLSGDG